MKKFEKIQELRSKLRKNIPSVGSWMQIPHPSIAEIMGSAGFDWVAVDLEHGSIDLSQLPDLFRSLELGNTLPLARISSMGIHQCKSALDAGAAGIIVPMVESASDLEMVMRFSKWPPGGGRGVGFSRANLFGKRFQQYSIEEAAHPLIIAMIESKIAVDSIDEILNVDGLDAIFIGPYDLSASLGCVGQFDNKIFKDVVNTLTLKARLKGIAFGIHVISPNYQEVLERINEGYTFIAYSLDSVFLTNSIKLE